MTDYKTHTLVVMGCTFTLHNDDGRLDIRFRVSDDLPDDELVCTIDGSEVTALHDWLWQRAAPLVTLSGPPGTSCDNPPQVSEFAFPASGRYAFPRRVYYDEYHRHIAEYFDGTCYVWESLAQDYLPLLT